MDVRARVADGFGGAWSRRLIGTALGVVATGSGLAVAELLVGMIHGSSSPVIAVGQKVIDLVPPSLKNWAIETFGTSDKTVLVVTTLILVFLAGIAIGELAMEGRRTAASVGRPVHLCRRCLRRADPAGPDVRQDRPDPGRWGRVGRGVARGSRRSSRPHARRHEHGAAHRRRRRRLGDTSGEPALTYTPMFIPGFGSTDRRQFLTRSVGAASIAAITGGAGRCPAAPLHVGDERAALALPEASSRPLTLPPNADLDVPGLSPFVTPNGEFYRIDTALVVPQVSKDDWSLRIHGMVEKELELTFDDLLARDQVEVYITLSCVSNPVGGPYVGNALWQGVRIADLLAEVGVDPASTQLLSTSADGWTCGTPVSSLNDGRNALLAIAMNGEPLPAEHGYPVRMVVPGEYGYVSATKWVVDWEFTTWEDEEAYWVPRGWSQIAPMKTMTRIETPDHNQSVAAGAMQIAGTALGRPPRGVARGGPCRRRRVDAGAARWCPVAGHVAQVGRRPRPRRRRVRDRGPHDRRGRQRRDGRSSPTSRPNGASGYDRIGLKVE